MEIVATRDDGVATVTLNRPERRNALNDDLLERLGAALDTLREDTGVRVVVLTGTPPVFSAGADAGLRSSMTAEERRAVFANRRSNFLPLFTRVLEGLETLPQPTLAMINGHAIGGGWALTLACDLRFAAGAAQFWIPEVDLGVPLAAEMTARFLRLVGPARTLEITLEGRRYSAEEAREMDLVHRVVEADALAGAVGAYSRMLAAKPAAALAGMKEHIRRLAPVSRA
jgi:enoyl-CoA hydratase/carnithine racemase